MDVAIWWHVVGGGGILHSGNRYQCQSESILLCPRMNRLCFWWSIHQSAEEDKVTEVFCFAICAAIGVRQGNAYTSGQKTYELCFFDRLQFNFSVWFQGENLDSKDYNPIISALIRKIILCWKNDCPLSCILPPTTINTWSTKHGNGIIVFPEWNQSI